MIVARDLVKHYDGGLVKALNGISFEVERGEVVLIMGPFRVWKKHSAQSGGNTRQLPPPERS